MKHLTIVFIFISGLAGVVSADWLGDIANFVTPNKRIDKPVVKPLVCEPLKPATKPTNVDSALILNECRLGEDVVFDTEMSLADILTHGDCQCVSQVILARFNGLKSTLTVVPANRGVSIPTCEQADSIRAVMAQEKAEREQARVNRRKLPTIDDDGFWHWRRAAADPYDSAEAIPFERTLKLLGLPEDVKPLFSMAYLSDEYKSGYIEHGSVWSEMLSGKGKACKGPKGLKAEIGSASTKYAALIYTVEYNGYIYELANPSVCHNWMWRCYPKPDEYSPPPTTLVDTMPTKIDTVPIVVDTTPTEDTIPPPPPAKSCKNRIQSNLWSGLTTPLNHGTEGMQYFNSYLGADFYYYFCAKSFSDPHFGIGGSLNSWGGRGFPHAYYYGGQPDIGVKLVVPFSIGAFTVGPFIGLACTKAVSNDSAGRYEGRQTTFPLIIERVTLDFYWPKCELNWWGQGTQGLRSYKASTFNGVALDNVYDPAATVSSLGTGLKIFFGAANEMANVDMGNGVIIPQLVPKRFRFGIFSEFNTTFEGVSNGRYDEDPAYAIGLGPAFQFPRSRVIISQKNLYLWHFKNSYNNGYTAGVELNWEIAQRFWAPGGKK